MPCYDGREDQDRENQRRRYDALTALLCGVLHGNESATTFGRTWLPWHELVDLKRQDVEYDWEDKKIAVALRHCDQVLDEAYNQLCVDKEVVK